MGEIAETLRGIHHEMDCISRSLERICELLELNKEIFNGK